VDNTCSDLILFPEDGGYIFQEILNSLHQNTRRHIAEYWIYLLIAPAPAPRFLYKVLVFHSLPLVWELKIFSLLFSLPSEDLQR